jgi:hypothetical protein
MRSEKGRKELRSKKTGSKRNHSTYQDKTIGDGDGQSCEEIWIYPNT